MKIAIIDYGSGNLRSAQKSFERVVDKNSEVKITSDKNYLRDATHIVLPGVGAFADCFRGLSSISGMISALEKEVIENKKPFLGICVGMQLLADYGNEHGKHKGLGWVSGEVVPLTPTNKSLKIPHMGWNELIIKKPHNLLKNINSGDHAYFVHSYHFLPSDRNLIIAEADYGGSVTAVIAKDNIMGTQFHPEKSQKTGLSLIRNFMAMQ